jgi:hypothetical protein
MQPAPAAAQPVVLEGPPRIARQVQARRGQSPDLVIVRAPSGREFQIYLVEWQLARLMDGSRSLPQLLEEARKLGVAPTPEQMASLIRQLGTYGLLEGSPLPPAPSAPVPSAVDAAPSVAAAHSPPSGADLAPEPDERTATGEAPPRAVEPHEPVVSNAALEAPEPPVAEDDWSMRQAERRRGRKRLAVALVTLGAVTALLWAIPYPLKVTERAELRPAKRMEIRAQVEGIITEIRKQEGQ